MDNGEIMKRTFALILAGLIAIALFTGLVYFVLVATHVSEPTATTVHGATPRRLWATTVALLALGSMVVGSLALRGNARKSAIVALVAGLIAAVNGGLNLAVATGGLGSGNGVVGGAAALVLGLLAMVLGALALGRSRRGVNKGPLVETKV